MLTYIFATDNGQQVGVEGQSGLVGSGHSCLAAALNNLASVRRDQHDYAEAKTLYWRALTINEQTLGPEHPAMFNTLYNLADTYRALRRYRDASAEDNAGAAEFNAKERGK